MTQQTNLPSKLPDRVPIDMTRYPHLANLGKEGAGPLVSSTFQILEEGVKNNWHNISEDYFGMPLQELISNLLGAMFDHEGIMKFHPIEDTGQALSEMYEHAVNPLTAAFTKEGLMDHTGEKISFLEKYGMNEKEFTVKKWLQGLLFYSYYCSLPDLARALAVSDYDLLDEEKHRNIAKLIELRPVLDYQKRTGILPGKLIPGTGFFYAGKIQGLHQCPACQVPGEIYDLCEIAVCTSCKAGFDK